MNILIIGYGNTGKEIVKNLVKLSYVKTIFIFDPFIKNVRDNKKIKFLNKLKNTNFDYVIITFSTISSKKRINIAKIKTNNFDVRHIELKSNIKKIKEYISFLNTLNKQTKIIVVTNPIDEITNYLQKKIKDKTIIGFGMELDAKRFSKEFNKKVTCIGLHGKAIPLLNLKSKLNYKKLQKKVDLTLLKFVRANGIPSKFVGLVFFKFFKKLNSNQKNKLLLCYKIGTLSISIPFKVQKGKMLNPVNIKLNKIEIELFKNEIKELKNNLKGL